MRKFVKNYRVGDVYRRLNYFLKNNGVENPNQYKIEDRHDLYCKIRGISPASRNKTLIKEWLAKEFGLTYELTKPKKNKSKKTKVVITTRLGEKKQVSAKKKAYLEYIDSQKWKNLRNEILAERGLVCQKCNIRKPHSGLLNVHHMTYERLFNELKTDLLVLCIPCHKEVHRMPRKNNPYFI